MKIYHLFVFFILGTTAHAAQQITVSPDGSGDFSAIQPAIDSIVDATPGNRYEVHISPGIYNEQVLPSSHIDLIGAGAARVTNNLAAGEPPNLWQHSGTLKLDGVVDCAIHNIAFENTSDVHVPNPALSTTEAANEVAFFNCIFDAPGWGRDTVALRDNQNLEFYDCQITGHHDVLSFYSVKALLVRCRLRSTTNTSTQIWYGGETADVEFRDCRFEAPLQTSPLFIHSKGADGGEITLIDCESDAFTVSGNQPTTLFAGTQKYWTHFRISEGTEYYSLGSNIPTIEWIPPLTSTVRWKLYH